MAYGIPCKRCGWGESDHLEKVYDDAEHQVKPGYDLSLRSEHSYEPEFEDTVPAPMPITGLA